ncbi:MAG: hypothetical protein AABY83_10280 [Pseudomonadota bacterium]
MADDIEQALIYRVANATVYDYPYPHVYIQDIFPVEYYKQLLVHLPGDEQYARITDTGRVKGERYDARLVIDLAASKLEQLSVPQREFWQTCARYLLNGPFLAGVMSRFKRPIEDRFRSPAGARISLESQLLLTRDKTSYNIGPHTDAPSKLLTLLFYLPHDHSQIHLGTSIYVAKNPDFRCAGGPHHPFSEFKKVTTARFAPNTVFGFLRTDQSFHGVETITDAGVSRNLLIFNVKIK